MWQAIDLDTIQKRVMRGKSRNIGVMVAPPVPGYDAALDKLPQFNPDGAKKLLADAGYPNGFKTKLDCTNDRYIADEQICVAIAAMWKRVGIDVELKTESRATYFPRQDRGETDVYMLGWATLPPMDSYSVLSAIFASRGAGIVVRRQQPERPVGQALRRTGAEGRRRARRDRSVAQCSRNRSRSLATRPTSFRCTSSRSPGR